MKYMSEVFLELLGNDFSTENVRQTAAAVGKLLNDRTTELSGQEARDLWDVMKEFSYLIDDCSVKQGPCQSKCYIQFFCEFVE